MANNSNRNSLKESTSNRSSMDVSTCSYNTLIIHNDDSMYSSGAGADYGGVAAKKDRPRSFGTDQVIKEILETPDYSQNSVLKQLVKEMKLPGHPPKYGLASGGSSRDLADRDCEDQKSGLKHDKTYAEHHEEEEEEDDEDDEEENENGDQAALSKLKSKSQPDLSRIIDIDLETIEALMKDNLLLKEQLNHSYKKVARTKKVSHILARSEIVANVNI